MKLNGVTLLDDMTTDINVGNADIQVRDSKDSYYIGVDDFLVKTSVPDDRIIKISFSEECTLKVDNIEVYWYPTDHVAEWTEELRKEYIRDLKVERDCISGTIDASKNSWLFLSIPYSEGWSAYIDDEEVEIQKANIGFMAVPVKAGSHEIYLEYHAPGSRVGRVLAVCGWLVFGMALIYE